MRSPLLLLILTSAVGSPAMGPEPLFEAIRRTDAAALGRALDRGVPADAKDADGVPALMAAALFAGPDCVRLLLDRGADPNATTGDGATALMWSIPNLEKVKLLLARGADVNARSNNLHRTPLLIAAGYPGTVEILRLLLEKGADLHARDKAGDLALGRARDADIEVVRFLVERGIGVNEKNAGDATALSRAISRPYRPTIDFLLSKGATIGKTSLVNATHWQDPELVAKLIAMGADVNARTASFGRTPLINAVSSERTSPGTVKLLLDKGADPNLADNDGEKPLDWAMHRADRAKIDLLRKYGGTQAETPRDKTWPKPEGIAGARTSLERSAALLIASSQIPFQKRACITCHNQSMPAQVVAAARERGLPVNEEVAARNLTQIRAVYRPLGGESMQGSQVPGGDLTVGYIVMALAAGKHPMDMTTAALTHGVLGRQMPDGSWIEAQTRPPMEYSSISRTAMAVRAITLYPIEARRQEIADKLRRSRVWLTASKPQSAEEYAMRLMALAWTGAARAELDAAGREWIAAQRSDGGWAQLPHLGTDAYATGITLYAMYEAGIPVTDAAYRKGIEYLLRNQYRDGSWFVKTRSFPVQPQMESGYPFGYNQWISAAGATWASLAIANTLPLGQPLSAGR
ncbi:MAG TPA: ankyrin repeat domain-containing protein [Bryobacteraceae bacterium]|nr:ankyrin repeat domain-containing protein [Bryobacteraceae bacterium]